MSELINAAVNIKDPLTLFAFLAVVLLVAFRTKTVPESVFKLLSSKITRERFYLLLNRSLAYGLVVFLVLCGVAVLGQVLDYMTTAKAASVDQLKTELALRRSDDAAAQRAIDAYEKGLALAQAERVNEAIASFESSLKAVPTAAARETLALLYQQAGDTERATTLAEQVVVDARESGNALSRARAERLLSTSRQTSDSAASVPQGLGIGTVRITNPGSMAVEVYSQESKADWNLAPGYAGTLTAAAPVLHVPAGEYKLKFANQFAEHVRVESGKTTRLN